MGETEDNVNAPDADEVLTDADIVVATDASDVADDADGEHGTDADSDAGADTDTPAETAETAESFDDIAASVAEPVVVADSGAVPQGPTVPWWPFLAYLGAWVVLAAAAVWQLLQLPATEVAYESSAYGLMILGGLIMTAVGPLLILAVWFATRAARSADDRSGLLTSSLLKGALVTLSGAIVWWAALVIVDYLRLGRPL